MIKTLYVRVVLIFWVIVAASMLLSFFIIKELNGTRIYNQFQWDTLDAGEQIVRYCTENQVQDVEAYVNSLKSISPFKIYLYRENTAARADFPIRPEEVEKVLHGGVYQSFGDKKIRSHDEIVAGLPFEVHGTSYALFLERNIRHLYKGFDGVVRTGLILSLIVGSLLVAAASRYLIRPIKMLTRATQKIASGDYNNLEIPIHNKNEIGILANSFNHMVKELSQMEKMRQNFVSDVSHEIQSPLTSIRGFSATLLQGELPEEDQKRCLSIIAEESERLSRLCEDLLKLASLDSEHHPYAPAKYRLDEQLRRVVISSEPMRAAKNIHIDLSLEETYIIADEDQLAQVWTNLIINSMKYTQPGGQISIQLTQSNHEVSVRIADNGIGIDEDDLGRIFQRFYKADKARDRSRGGSGLGLAIVKKIIDIHNGRIEVQSQPNQGTVITILLEAGLE
ncbi:HAMP domain-containing protein [Cohnella pontilimi]|uniref:Heme sensor protein HssS n=1 Tax=Cohnella pontilimi TaxID=2564100 RepID=A0A4U0FBV8_9BACL|nr:HAMP domain-containing sensor histidine kinase [Cohnella pontilimi]TJY42343.1 HAMP domain-containing protein [Cohnella pontilimi]